jgi:hypothetical protein
MSRENYLTDNSPRTEFRGNIHYCITKYYFIIDIFYIIGYVCFINQNNTSPISIIIRILTVSTLVISLHYNMYLSDKLHNMDRYKVGDENKLVIYDYIGCTLPILMWQYCLLVTEVLEINRVSLISIFCVIFSTIIVYIYTTCSLSELTYNFNKLKYTITILFASSLIQIINTRLLFWIILWVIYTIASVFKALEWPLKKNTYFNYHDLMHVFAITGNIYGILYIVPYFRLYVV